MRVALSLVVSAFFEKVQMEGAEHIPAAGRVVMAPNHPFGFLDSTVLLQYFLNHQSLREWAYVGQVNQLHRNLPGWDKGSGMGGRIIALRHDNGRVTNARDIICSAVDFLRERENPVLFIDPEGPDAYLKSSTAKPHRGFAAIARQAEAPIVPVLFTGRVNVPELTFTIHGRILPAMEPSNDDQITRDEWVKRITDML